MTPAQYRAALAALGLTQAEAAMIMDVSVRTSNGYANGWPIPFLVAYFLENELMRKSAMALSLGQPQPQPQPRANNNHPQNKP